MLVVKELLGELTNSSRGSQKSKSLLSETVERGTGEGEGESDGQEDSRDKRSGCWRAAANEVGLMKTATNELTAFSPLGAIVVTWSDPLSLARLTGFYHYVPGVNGGEPQRVQSPPARISVCTSPSHPSFTPSRLSMGSRPAETGVGRISHVDGGLLTVLADTERGGVDG